MKKLLAALGNLLFPPRCMFCRRIIDGGWICGECGNKLPLAGTVGKGGEFYTRCVAPLKYTGDVRRAVLGLKFRGRSGYAQGFASLMAPLIRRELEGQFDVVTWVPLSRKRLRKRGYDQARLIAQEVSKLLGTRLEQLLVKTEDTPAQSGIKGRAQRAANVSGVYRAPDGACVAGRRVLLIDDVVTTGATFSECSRELLMAGAERIVCCAAASAMSVKKR